jgi:hypothetical protein
MADENLVFAFHVCRGVMSSLDSGGVVAQLILLRRLARSSIYRPLIREQRRLKEELARMTFGEESQRPVDEPTPASRTMCSTSFAI